MFNSRPNPFAPLTCTPSQWLASCQVASAPAYATNEAIRGYTLNILTTDTQLVTIPFC